MNNDPRYHKFLQIGNKKIGEGEPTFFIADIAANHDGDIKRAKNLIRLAAEAGADAAKFQHFQAKSIVSDVGFRSLGGQKGHQSKWNKTVFEVYSDASVSLDWTEELRDACEQAGIIFFTSPYSFDLVDYIDQYVPAYKIGSGDITWLEIIHHIAKKNKPYLVATGASTLTEVQNAVDEAVLINGQICLMQCNTNYTGDLENFKYINLNVLKKYAELYPGMVLGLSDHTPGHSTVLGAISLGARMIEKHFTDDKLRAGPDHAFSMDFKDWSEMVRSARELENALGGYEKKVEENELETVVLQRRAVRAAHNLLAGTILKRQDLEVLRPCPLGAISADNLDNIDGKVLNKAIVLGECIKWTDLE